MTGIAQSGFIPIDRIIPNPGNRPDGSGDEDLPGLAASVAAYGVLEPLIVVAADARGMFDLFDGHQRLAAAVLAGETRVPVVIRRPGESAEEIALVANCQRTGMTPTETATAMGRLRDEQGWPAALIASRTGLSPATVSYHLELLELDPGTLDRVRRGDLTAKAAHAHIRATRSNGNGKPGNRKPRGPRPGSWFTATHPLAPAAAALCRGAGHPAGSRLGKIACGSCFEEAIRSDERAIGRRASAERGPAADARWDNPGLICGAGS